MGLFKRKAENKQELETMKSELQSMRQRLDAADALKIGLAEKLGHVEAENQRLVTHVVDVDAKASSSASADAVAKIETDVAKIGDLTSRIDELSASLQAQAAASTNLPAPDGPAISDLVAQLSVLSESLSHQQRQIADVALVATDAAERTNVAAAAVKGLAGLDRTPARNDDEELRQQLGQLAEKVGAIDARMNQVSLELTNQLTELSSDIDIATTKAPADNHDSIVAEIERLMAERIDPTILDVTDGQERLAVEQARYAIAFRQDLADLAGRLGKPNTR